MKNNKFKTHNQNILEKSSINDKDNCTHEFMEYVDRGDHGTGETYQMCSKCGESK